MLCLSTAALYLFPDVVVRQEAAQLSFCQGPAVVGVVVARQHVDPHTLDLTHVHGSKIHSKHFCYLKKQGVTLTPFCLLRQTAMNFHSLRMSHDL